MPYYGEWRVLFVTDSGVDFTHSLHITERAPDDLLQNGGLGLQFFCVEEFRDPCGTTRTFSSGFGFIGNIELDDGTTPLSLVIATQYNTNDEPELKIVSLEGLNVTTNSEGQQVLSGDGFWSYTGDSDQGSLGTITATNVGPPRILDPISSYGLRKTVNELRSLIDR